jgi:hypothetical protein
MNGREVSQTKDEISDESFLQFREILNERIFQFASKEEFKNTFTATSNGEGHEELRQFLLQSCLAPSPSPSLESWGPTICTLFKRLGRKYGKKMKKANKANELPDEIIQNEKEPRVRGTAIGLLVDGGSSEDDIVAERMASKCDASGRQKKLLILDLNKVLLYRKPKTSRYVLHVFMLNDV